MNGIREYLFMPFAEAGVGIPMEKLGKPTGQAFCGVSIGNNGHTYVGGTAGFTIDFLRYDRPYVRGWVLLLLSPMNIAMYTCLPVFMKVAFSRIRQI